MAEGNRKPEVNDPEMMARLLELELAQKRAAWQHTHAQRQKLRMFSFVFLFLIVAGAFAAFYFLFSSDKLDEMKSHRPNVEQTSPTPTATP